MEHIKINLQRCQPHE